MKIKTDYITDEELQTLHNYREVYGSVSDKRIISNLITRLLTGKNKYNDNKRTF